MKNKTGKITSEQKGLFNVWKCTCETPCLEIDESTVECLEEVGGCGSFFIRGHQE